MYRVKADDFQCQSEFSQACYCNTNVEAMAIKVGFIYAS